MPKIDMPASRSSGEGDRGLGSPDHCGAQWGAFLYRVGVVDIEDEQAGNLTRYDPDIRPRGAAPLLR